MFGKCQCFQQMCAAPHNRTRTLEGLCERFGVENSRERARERESERENEKERQRVETQDWARNEGWSDLFFKRQGPDGVNVVRAKARDEKASATDEDAEGIERRERRPERIFSLLLFPFMLHAGRQYVHPLREYVLSQKMMNQTHVGCMRW